VRLISALLCLCALVTAQTTGVPGINDLTINGGGSGSNSGTNCGVVTTVPSAMTLAISAAPGSAIIGGAANNCVVGSVPVGGAGTTLDIDFVSLGFWIDGTGLLGPGNPLNAFAFTDGGGNWSLSVTSNSTFAPLAVQCAVVDPGGNISMTQAYVIGPPAPPSCYTHPGIGPNGDDSTLQAVFSVAMMPFYGTMYGDIWINSNGNLTFNAGDTDFTSSEGEMLANAPRIAPVWDDMSPNIAGTITFGEYQGGALWACTWDQVPHFASAGDSNTFCAELDLTTGIVTCGADLCTLANGTSFDTITGISPGGNLSGPNNIDLSTSSGYTAPGATDAVYEDFFQGLYGPWDLSYSSTVFLPTGGPGVGPYQVL